MMIYSKSAFIIICMFSFCFLSFTFSVSAKSTSKEELIAFVTIKATVPKEYNGTISIHYEQIDGHKVGSIMVGLTPLNNYCFDGLYYIGTYKKVSILLSDPDYYVATKNTLDIQSETKNKFTFNIKKKNSPKNTEVPKRINNVIENNKKESYLNFKDYLFSNFDTNTTKKNAQIEIDDTSKSVHGELFQNKKVLQKTNKDLSHFFLNGGITLIFLIILSIVYFIIKKNK